LAEDENEFCQWLEDYDALNPLEEGEFQFLKGAIRFVADLHPDWVLNSTRKDFTSWIEEALHLLREVDEHAHLAIPFTLRTETNDIVLSLLLIIQPLNIPQNIETICTLQLLINEFLKKASAILPGSSCKTEGLSSKDERFFRKIMEGLDHDEKPENKSQ